MHAVAEVCKITKVSLTEGGNGFRLIAFMSTESLNRTSDVVKTPSQIGDTPMRVNVDVLKQRLFEEKKKEKFKRTIIVSSVVASLGVISFFTY